MHATVLYDQMKRISDYFLEKDYDFEHDFFCSLYNDDFFKPKDVAEIQNWCGGTGSARFHVILMDVFFLASDIWNLLLMDNKNLILLEI